jgi:hypothetical protein
MSLLGRELPRSVPRASVRYVQLSSRALFASGVAVTGASRELTSSVPPRPGTRSREPRIEWPAHARSNRSRPG